MEEEYEYDYEKQKQEKRKKRFDSLLQTGICILAAVGISYLIVHFIVQRTVVDGTSMNNTLMDGDNLLVEKLSYRFGDVERFDIVVFPYHDEEKGDVYYIKRVIGMPGELVQIKNGSIYIDGELLEEDYGYYMDGRMMQGYLAEEEILIGDDEYFVLGDNRNGSKDSRQIGCVKRDAIEGRAFFRIFPFGEFGNIK